MGDDKNTVKILFFGDLVGRPGRSAVRDFMVNPKAFNYKTEPVENPPVDTHFIIANVENASHGFGLTEKNYKELSEYGIDAMTSGNHIWDKKEIFNYINNVEKLLRPINYPNCKFGIGGKIFEKNGVKIGVISVLGRVFMNLVDSQWEIVQDEIKRMKEITPIVVVDFHAEATAEKICFGRFCAELGVSAFFGTHTHVQTADEMILNNMGYISDAGFCGTVDSVIGMEFATSFKRLSTSLPERYEISEDSCAQINGIEVYIDEKQAIQIKRINIITDNNIQETEVSFDSGV